MSQYSWATCSDVLRTQINNLTDTLQEELLSNLIGVYLHGSLAMGCFNPQRSDIDLLVVTQQGLTVETKREIAQYLLASSLSPAPIEISFLVQEQIHPFRHPLPYDLHYSEDWRERHTLSLATGTWRAWNDETRHDADLATHLTVVRARGICLYGKPILAMFPAVPPEYYIASIVGDFDDANVQRQTGPVYFVLNACRVSAYLREGHISSKDEGGAWGLQALPSELHGVIEQALGMYRGNLVNTPFDDTSLTQFARYMEQYIYSVYYPLEDTRFWRL